MNIPVTEFTHALHKESGGNDDTVCADNRLHKIGGDGVRPVQHDLGFQHVQNPLVGLFFGGGYAYGDKASFIDMNSVGVDMLEDNLFCNSEFSATNPNTVKAFIYTFMKGWEYACAHPEEAAQIVLNYGSSVSSEHQAYMAGEVKKLVETDTRGNKITSYGKLTKPPCPRH